MEAASESLLANQATTTTVYGSAALEQSAGDIEPPHVRGRIKMLFAALIFVQAMLNYDSGAIPSSLIEITNRYDLQFSQQGMLGSLVYLGLSVSSLLAGYILQVWSPKWVIAISMVANLGFCLMFVLAPSILWLMVSRFGVGASQAFLVIYSPVWVDEYAPRQLQTMWISLLQAGIPLGIMAGYLVSGLLSRYAPDHWILSFWVQIYALAPFVLMMFFIPEHYINLRSVEFKPDVTPESTPISKSHSVDITDKSAPIDIFQTPAKSSGKLADPSFTRMKEPPTNSVDNSNRRRSLRQQQADAAATARRRSLMTNAVVPESSTGASASESIGFVSIACTLIARPVFICTTLALCSLFFVVAGIQFWITPYLVSVLKVDLTVVVFGFTITSATAPIFGVLFGGWMVDRLGGYKGVRGLNVAAKSSAIFGLIAVLCGVPAIFITSFLPFIALIWLLLFFGGAVLPPATGIVMSSVPQEMRAMSNSVSMLLYNCLGYFLGPFLPGVVAEVTDSLAWGFRLILLWSFFATIFMSLSWWFARRDHRRAKYGIAYADGLAAETCTHGLIVPDLSVEEQEEAIASGLGRVLEDDEPKAAQRRTDSSDSDDLSRPNSTEIRSPSSVSQRRINKTMIVAVPEPQHTPAIQPAASDPSTSPALSGKSPSPHRSPALSPFVPPLSGQRSANAAHRLFPFAEEEEEQDAARSESTTGQHVAIVVHSSEQPAYSPPTTNSASRLTSPQPAARTGSRTSPSVHFDDSHFARALDKGLAQPRNSLHRPAAPQAALTESVVLDEVLTHSRGLSLSLLPLLFSRDAT